MEKEFIVKPSDVNLEEAFSQKTVYLQDDVSKRLDTFIDKYSKVYSKKVIFNKLVSEILKEYGA